MRTPAAVAAIVCVLTAAIGVRSTWVGTRAQEPGPSLEQLRAAVASLPPGRFARPVSWDTATPAQQAYVRGILTGPRNAVSGPLAAMIASPALGEVAQRTMAYARFAGTEGAGLVPPRLNELAILMAARAWSSEYVWNAHAAYAVRMGLPAAVVEAIRVGRRPPQMDADVAAVYGLLDELLRTRRLSDDAFATAKSALGGDAALVDLVGTFAIYSMTAVLAVVDDTVVAPGYVPQLPPVAGTR
jgi:4-carboxymuconolactone decarboxylase